MEFAHRRCMKRWKDSLIGKVSALAFLIGIPTYTLGGGTVPTGDAPSEWDLTRWLLATLFTVIGGMLLRTMNKFDRNQNLLFERLRESDEKNAAQDVKIAVIEERCDLLACAPKNQQGNKRGA